MHTRAGPRIFLCRARTARAPLRETQPKWDRVQIENGRSLGGTARPSPHRFDGGERISKKVITRKEYVS
jgi:hypothetical protein